MAITREKKEQVVQELATAFDEARVVVVTDYKGLDVNAMTDLRQKLREHNGKFLVTKKTLLKIALEEKGIEGINPLELEGQIGLAFGFEDAVAASKAVYETQKETETLKILTGLMGEKLLTADQIVELAKLPSREELLAKVVGSINAPVSGFVNVLGGNIRNVVYALNAIKETK